MINDRQTLKMISRVESFLCPDKQGAHEEDRRIPRPKRYVTINNNKDEDNSRKNHTKYYSSYLFVMSMFQVLFFMFICNVNVLRNFTMILNRLTILRCNIAVLRVNVLI